MRQNKRVISLIIIFTIVLSLLQLAHADSLKYENGGVEFWTNTTDGNALYCSIKDNLPKLPDGTMPPKAIRGYPLNFRLWLQKGLLVYGNYSSIKDKNQFKIGTQPSSGIKLSGGYYYSTDSKTGETDRGEWRYHGIDINGNLFSNINFIDDMSGTKFDERNFYKEPWESLPKNLPSKSIYNKAAYGDDGEDIDTQAKLQNWINASLPDGVPLKDKPADPNVYQYLNILSAPTSMRPGQGRMWHNVNNKVWYQTLSVPELKASLENLPVSVSIYCTNPAADLKIKDPGPKQDSQKVTLNFKVIAALEDDQYYQDPIEKTKYYTRNDIGSWAITFNGGTPVKNIATIGNKGVYSFSETVTYGYLRSMGWKEFVTADAQPVYKNTVEGIVGHGSTTVYLNRTPEPVPAASVDFPTIFNPHNNIPEIAFEDFPFKATDGSDMSKVTSRTVFVDGQEVEDSEFFSGSYLFNAGDLGTNGRFAVVEVDYEVKGVILQNGDKICTTDYVYIYPTKPIANFKISSSSWKQNRKIRVEDTSAAGNIQLVVQNFPITEYEWSFGGDTAQIKVGNDTPSMKEFLCKQPGAYSAALRVKNSLGKWSDPYTVEFGVLEDIEPAVELNLSDSVMARNEDVTAWNYSVASTDGDLINTASIELWYDSDNDGTAESKINTWDGKGPFPAYKPDKLGYYKYIVTAKEEFGESTFTQFISDTDKKLKTYEVEFWVDNFRPMSDLYINMPIQRPNIDLYILIDRNIDPAKKDFILNNRMTISNWLLGKNIIPTVSEWDMRTYTYNQPASTTVHTGGTYPSDTTSCTSNGYSGTLSLSNVTNNRYSRDQGSYQTKTESKTATGSGTGYNYNYFKFHVTDKKTGAGSWTQTGSSGSDRSSISYSDSDGYRGTLSKTSTTLTYDSGTPSGKASDGATYTRVRYYSASYSGTVSRTVTYWVPNIVWYNDYTGEYAGTIYKDVRQPYTDPFSATSTKYVIYFSDSGITDLNDLQMVMGYAKTAKLILAGNSSIKSQTAYDTFFDTSSDNISTVVDNILQYIGENSPAVEKYIMLQNETVTLNVGNLDLENDPITAQEILYVQDPNYFDNPTGTEAGAVLHYGDTTGWTTAMKTDFANVGRYQIYRRIKDRPSTDLRFDEYSYYSGVTSLEVFVHRKPIALASLDWDYDSGKGLYKTTWVDRSYDLDHQYSREDKGIVERKIMYRLKGGEWVYNIPDNLAAGEYELRYYVRDLEGAWSDPFTLNFTLQSAPPMQFNANLRTLDARFSLAGIPASEFLEAFELWTRYPFDVRLEMAMFSGSNRVTPLKTINYTTATGVKSGNDINWYNINYQIPETLPDNNYTFRISAIGQNSQMETKEFSVKVITPVNLVPSMPESVVCTTSAQIKAATSKYASTAQVTLFSGTSYQSTFSMNGSAEGFSKNWTVNCNIPSVPTGNYIARFTARTPNGNTETKDVTFKVENMKIASVTISGYWNHWRGQQDLFGQRLSDEPHRFLSLECVKINVNTIGDPDRVVVRFSLELEAMTYTDPNGNTYDYSRDYFGHYVNFPGDTTFKVTGNHVYWEYYLPLAPSTKSWEDVRLKTPYKMTVTAYKGTVTDTYVIDDIDITGNIYDQTYIQPAY